MAELTKASTSRTVQTKSGLVLTGAMVFGFLPQAVVSVFGGVWADRHDRRRLIIAAWPLSGLGQGRSA